MVVKEKRGRRRYIAFRAERRLTDEELLAILNATMSPRGIKVPRVIQFDGRLGIIRCSPSDKDKVVAALAERSDPRGGIETLRTSGTLLTLREKFFPKPEARE
jgi:RNase P/RNase MRP subunit POP5